MTISHPTALLPPDANIGILHLTVADLNRAVTFYTEAIGLRVLHRSPGAAALGIADETLLLLSEQPGARPARGVTGLYHFAILLPTRRDLAAALARLLELRVPLQGTSDHGVSEALYLADLDGNGIEIYRDRPRAEWPRAGRELAMTVDPFDADGVLGELGDETPKWAGLPAGTTIGHMHLHVANLAPARRFYCEVIGFELMQRFGGSAEFVAAGGYHHHLGYNVWAGVGAPPPAPEMAGLRWFSLRLPDDTTRDAVLARAAAAGLTAETTPYGPLLRDPSANGVVLELAGHTG